MRETFKFWFHLHFGLSNICVWPNYPVAIKAEICAFLVLDYIALALSWSCGPALRLKAASTLVWSPKRPEGRGLRKVPLWFQHLGKRIFIKTFSNNSFMQDNTSLSQEVYRHVLKLQKKGTQNVFYIFFIKICTSDFKVN